MSMKSDWSSIRLARLMSFVTHWRFERSSRDPPAATGTTWSMLAFRPGWAEHAVYGDPVLRSVYYERWRKDRFAEDPLPEFRRDWDWKRLRAFQADRIYRADRCGVR